MSAQASLAIAQTAPESNRPRPVVRRRYNPRRDNYPTGEPTGTTTHDRFVASALALFPGSTIIDS